MIIERKVYDYSKRGKIAKEDFLRNGLVNDYLSKSSNKNYFKRFISDNPAVEITFHPEETKTYADFETSEERNDKIDISIYESGIQNLWSEHTDDEIKFAIECKRLNSLSDCVEYLKDVKKFAERKQTTFRLPTEGQIAFLENSSLTHKQITEEVNRRLSENNDIETKTILEFTQICDSFHSSYKSVHLKKFENHDPFKIFHLMFDFSSIVFN